MTFVSEVGGRLLALLAIALFACATGCGHNPPGPPAPNPCDGPAETKPCTCMDPNTPGCPPVPSDAKRKKESR
jgi:hypothetical protein